MATINVLIRDASAGNAPMSGVYVVLYDVTNNTSTQFQTNASGQISFTGLAAGRYRVYNTGIDTTGQNPPTQCGFPSGYTGTTTARRLDFNLGAAGTGAANFFYDKPLPWTAINGGNPPNIGLTTAGGLNLATGAAVGIPAISNNGMGYSESDNLIYGQADATVITRSGARPDTANLTIPVSVTGNTFIGDCDLDGYFYTPATTNASFTCIDVNPTRTTYLRPMNPYQNFQEIFTSPYTVSYTPATSAITDADWAYVDSVKGIVGGISGTATMWILSLTTPRAYNVPLTGFTHVNNGLNLSDLKNYYAPTGSQIRKYRMSTTVAIGTVLSASTFSATGDGSRAQSAAVFYATPNTVKKVNKASTSQGDTLTYTVTITNTGIITGNNTVFYDTLPNGLSFVSDSIYLNGVQQTGVNLSSVNIGTLPVGQVFTITFNALVNSATIPLFTNQAFTNTNFIDTATDEPFSTTFQSNFVNTTNIFPYITTAKTVSKNYAIVGDILDYTITIRNTGTNTALNTILVDTMPLGTSFITNSIKVNGVTSPAGSTLSPTGLSVGTISAGQIFTVTFKASIVSIPSNQKVDNIGTVRYNFKDTTTTLTFSTNTNNVVTTIVASSLGAITKSVDKLFATCGDELTYTITIPNNGTVTATNVILRDTIPNGTTYVVSSATVNGVTLPSSTNPQTTGINVGTIGIGGLSTVTFKVTVNC